MQMIEEIELLLNQAISTDAVKLCKLYFGVEMDSKSAAHRKDEIVEKHRGYLSLIKHLKQRQL